jgi:hypothetical protein
VKLSCSDATTETILIEGSEQNALASEWAKGIQVDWSPEYGFGFVTLENGFQYMIRYDKEGIKGNLQTALDYAFRPAGQKVSQVNANTLVVWFVSKYGVIYLPKTIDQNVEYEHNVWISGFDPRNTDEFAYGPKDTVVAIDPSITTGNSNGNEETDKVSATTSIGKQIVDWWKNASATFPGGPAWLVGSFMVFTLVILVLAMLIYRWGTGKFGDPNKPIMATAEENQAKEAVAMGAKLAGNRSQAEEIESSK